MWFTTWVKLRGSGGHTSFAVQDSTKDIRPHKCIVITIEGPFCVEITLCSSSSFFVAEIGRRCWLRYWAKHQNFEPLFSPCLRLWRQPSSNWERTKRKRWQRWIPVRIHRVAVFALIWRHTPSEYWFATTVLLELDSARPCPTKTSLWIWWQPASPFTG